jgi:hypothetical protein
MKFSLLETEFFIQKRFEERSTLIGLNLFNFIIKEKKASVLHCYYAYDAEWYNTEVLFEIFGFGIRMQKAFWMVENKFEWDILWIYPFSVGNTL